ncbi:MAG: hypothetical protein KDC98_23490 [Planctomycetes bacterium]|nr:hypothetical protein [Planctomycetota bacterium]
MKRPADRATNDSRNAATNPAAHGERRPEITAEGGHRSLLDHAAEKAALARSRFGPDIGYERVRAMLQDSTVVRYPTRLAFAIDGLEPGMFAIARPLGERPADGFVINVHPHFEGRDDDLPLLIAYHFVAINYGEIADATVAELFGATLLGLGVEDYYERLCALADELS